MRQHNASIDPAPGASRTPDPLTQARRLALVAVLLILAVLAILTAFNLKSQAINSKAHTQWHHYSTGIERKSQLISRIHQHLGYAGMIHHFKNAVLRRDPAYLDQAGQHIEHALEAIAEYRALGTSTAEIEALQAVDDTIDRYTEKIALIRQMIAAGADAHRIDTRVKVDDSAATAALASLRTIWRQNHEATESAFEQMFHDYLSLSRLSNYLQPLYFLFSVIVIAIFMRLINTLQHQHQQQLRSERRAAAIVDNSSEAIITIDDRGRIETFNPAASRLFGFQPADVLGQSVSLLMPECWRQRHEAYLADMQRRGGDVMGKVREVEGQRKDGSPFPLEISIAPIRDEYSKRSRYLGICRDISQRKQIEREQQQARHLAEQARRDAERASKAKTRLLSQVSHELRTPLNAILGFAQLLRLDPRHPLSEAQAQRVDEIEQAGHHLLELVEELLDLARIESGHAQLQIEILPVDELLQDCLSLITPLANEQGLEVALAHDHRPGQRVRADAGRLKQVLLNLLSNACKYNRPGGKIHLRCQAAPQAGRLRISVSDTGQGIDPDKLDQLFTPFERLDAQERGIEGSGIGLVISKQLVEQMGGELDLINRPGQGCSFWLELPAAPAKTD